MGIPEDEFRGMLVRARNFRRRVDQLGAVSGAVIVENLRRSTRPLDSLPPAQRELAEEIGRLLEDPRLSNRQAAYLERAFFGGLGD